MRPLALSLAPRLISFLPASPASVFCSAFLSAGYPMVLVPWTVRSRSSCLSVSLTDAAFFGVAFFVALALGVPAFEAVAAFTAGAFALAAFLVAAFFLGAAFFVAFALLFLVVAFFFTAIVSIPHIQGRTDLRTSNG